jgi:hypothetical protein
MAPLTWAHVVDHVSTLSTVDVDQQTDLLALANTGLNVAVFGGEDHARTKLARIYFIAHFASLAGAGDQRATGPVISESRGKVSRAYAAAASGGGADADAWDDTQWGRRYKLLLMGSRARWPRTP